MVRSAPLPVRPWSHGSWRPGLKFRWPPSSRRTLLLGLNPVQSHAWQGRFLTDLGSPLRLIESGAATATGAREWLNFSMTVVSAGGVSARVDAWTAVQERLRRESCPVILSAGPCTPAWKAAQVVTEVLPLSPHLLLDVPGRSDLEGLCAAGPQGVPALGWDVTLVSPGGVSRFCAQRLALRAGLPRDALLGVPDGYLVAFTPAGRYLLRCPDAS